MYINKCDGQMIKDHSNNNAMYLKKKKLAW